MKLLIVDDEPLVQVGLQSMLDWKSYQIDICGTAKNGKEAYEYIVREQPDIVITDIKMPIMSGLELLKLCREESNDLPVFIMLTSYEDFQFAREALQNQAVDYLIKLELNEDVLKESITKAIKVVKQLKPENEPSNSDIELSLLQNRFYIRLLNNLFDDEVSLKELQKDYNISLTSSYYYAAHLKICMQNPEQSCDVRLYNNTIHMFENLISKYIPCTVIALDLKYFAVIFYTDDLDKVNTDYIKQSLKSVSETIYKYYSVTILAAIGSAVTTPENISSSYNDAKHISMHLSKEEPFLSIKELDRFDTAHQSIFNLSLFKKDLVKAFENYDIDALNKVRDSLLSLFASDTIHITQAVDVAGSILHFAISLIPDGHELVSSVFKEHPDGYLCLYQCKTVAQVLNYITVLTKGISDYFETYHDDYKNHFIIQVKEFIDSHITEKLSLQSVAQHFSISSNYLSQLFKQHLKIGFSEYITHAKMESAKKMLRDNNTKIYEIAEQLGFENAFYFSKVFKKVYGISPKEFVSKK